MGGRAIFYPPSKKMSDCSICYDAVIDFPAPEATGSYRSSCGHLFHPKCIATWHLRQEESTCPMCRKVATEMEDCAYPSALMKKFSEEEDEEEEDAEEEGEEEGDGYVGGTIRITWSGMDNLIYSEGGHGVTLSVEEDVGGFDENREVVITRYDFERILRQQGVGPFSDAQWLQLQSVYPDDEEDDESPVQMAEPTRQLTFAPPPPPLAQNNEQRKREIVAELSRLAAELALLMGPPLPVAEPLEDDEDDLVRLSRIEIDEDLDSEEAIHAPGPFDFVADLPTSPRFTLKRANIQRLLLRNGSNATMEEFFNEEDGEEQTLVVTMTLESLNARFASLGAAPVTFMEATVAAATLTYGEDLMEVKSRVILNPEDEEPELGVC